MTRYRQVINELEDQPRIQPEAAIAICRAAAAYIAGVSTRAPDHREQSLELPIEELLRHARPLPPHDEMLIEDLTEDEGAAFVSAVES